MSSQVWDKYANAYCPLRKTSLFNLEPIHLDIIQEKLRDRGVDAPMRCLYRWVDARSQTPPRLATALDLAEVLAEFTELPILDILYKLARKEIEHVATDT